MERRIALWEVWLFEVLEVGDEIFVGIEFEVGVVRGGVEVRCEFDPATDVDFEVLDDLGVVGGNDVAGFIRLNAGFDEESEFLIGGRSEIWAFLPLVFSQVSLHGSVVRHPHFCDRMPDVVGLGASAVDQIPFLLRDHTAFVVRDPHFQFAGPQVHFEIDSLIVC